MDKTKSDVAWKVLRVIDGQGFDVFPSEACLTERQAVWAGQFVHAVGNRLKDFGGSPSIARLTERQRVRGATPAIHFLPWGC